MRIDLHTDLPWQLYKSGWRMSDYFQVTKPKMVDGQLNQIVAALYLSDGIQDSAGDEDSWHLIEAQFDALMKLKPWIPFNLALEGGRLLGPDVPTRTERLAWLAARDCAYITLTHNFDNAWIGSATSGTDEGLTAAGSEVVQDMARFGILPDVSHCSDRSVWHVILAAEGYPVIASHSGARSITNHPRNLSDDLIYDIADVGGVIGIPFATRFVESKEGVIRHIDHIAQLLGSTKNISIGSDLDGAQTVIKDASEWSFWIEPLKAKGYTDSDIEGIGGHNFYRLIGGVPA